MTGQPSRRWAWREPLLGLGLLALVAALLWLASRQPALRLFLDRERLVAWIAGLGPSGPLAVIVLQIAQIIAAPVPGQLVGIASGFLFGPWLGALYNMIGVLLGNLLALLLARRCGRPLVRRLVPISALAHLDRLTQEAGLPLLLAIYLLPFLPGDSITLVAGLTQIPLHHIMLAVAVGRLPGILLSSWMGAGAAHLSWRQWGLVAVGVAVGVCLVLTCRSRLQARMWRLVEGLSRRRVASARARAQQINGNACAPDGVGGAQPRPAADDRDAGRGAADP